MFLSPKGCRFELQSGALQSNRATKLQTHLSAFALRTPKEQSGKPCGLRLAHDNPSLIKIPIYVTTYTTSLTIRILSIPKFLQTVLSCQTTIVVIEVRLPQNQKPNTLQSPPRPICKHGVSPALATFGPHFTPTACWPSHLLIVIRPLIMICRRY
jgi:hypothetical protein